MYCNIQQSTLTFNNQCKDSITQKYISSILKNRLNIETQQNGPIIEKKYAKYAKCRIPKLAWQ